MSAGFHVAFQSSGFDMGYWKSQNLDFVFQLEAVTIKLSDASNEIELVRYVLEYTQNLKKMTILCSSFQQPSDVQGKVSKCKMFSTAFVVIQ